VNPAAWTAIAALGAAGITGLTSFWLLRYQEGRREEAGRRQALSAACNEILWHSMGLLMRANNLANMAVARSGVKEGLDIAMRVRRPLDFLEVYDWMAKDWSPLSGGWSAIWLAGDQELVRLANDVLSHSGAVMTAFMLPEPPGQSERASRWFLGVRPTPADKAKQEAAVKDLASARKRFAEYSRSLLGVDSIDVFAQLAPDSGSPSGGPG
jgi:hypothetical protein